VAGTDTQTLRCRIIFFHRAKCWSRLGFWHRWPAFSGRLARNRGNEGRFRVVVREQGNDGLFRVVVGLGLPDTASMAPVSHRPRGTSWASSPWYPYIYIMSRKLCDRNRYSNLEMPHNFFHRAKCWSRLGFWHRWPAFSGRRARKQGNEVVSGPVCEGTRQRGSFSGPPVREQGNDGLFRVGVGLGLPDTSSVAPVLHPPLGTGWASSPWSPIYIHYVKEFK
jgi:hypothetical protein